MAPVIHIDDTRERIFHGHPWIFDNQVFRVEGDPRPGDVVRVLDKRRRTLGQAYFNPRSKIRARMLTWDPGVVIDAGFFLKRIQQAWDHRERMGCPVDRRVVFGEADGLPALVVDRFSDVLVIQTMALGIDRWKAEIVDALRTVTGLHKIYERNDVPIREKEGLDQRTGYVGEPFVTALEIQENGLTLAVDVAHGQKTGHFLDQRSNHAALEPIVKDMRVLDCFTHTGGFALHAAKYGAREVLGLDISEAAVGLAKANAERNGLMETCHFATANVFDHLTEASRTGQLWDVIVLDPPAFAKSRGALDNAYRGYKEINLRAMKCLVPGGFLVTCSCSQHMSPELFRKMVAEAARDAHRQVREVYAGSQPPDHPIHWSIPETHYLKCLILQIL